MSTQSLTVLPALLVEPAVRAALTEDLGRAGDITTASIVSPSARARAVIASRQPGVVAGLQCAAIAFRLIDSAVEIAVHRPDGSRVGSGDAVATITGPAQALLTAERVALNFLCHLSGVATATASLVDAVAGRHGTGALARAYLEYLFTPEAQEIGARHYYRPRDGAVAKKHAATFPQVRLVTIDEVFGGWQQAQKAHFADGGVFDQIYGPR